MAIFHSCKDTSVRNVMSTVQEVAFSFDYSSKKLQAFYQELDSDATTKENMDKRTKLRTLCETRWTSRADALDTLKTSFPVVIHALERLQGQYLLPRVIGNITNEQIATLYETYQTDLTCNLDEFKREVARWRTRWSITPRDQMPTSHCETLDAVNPVLYPSIDTILCIMLTMPVTSATAERSFSVLRRLKTYVRSTMNNDRLSSLALMHIHRDFSVDLDKVMEKFVSAKTRRTDFGQF